MPNKQQT